MEQGKATSLIFARDGLGEGPHTESGYNRTRKVIPRSAELVGEAPMSI